MFEMMSLQLRYSALSLRSEESRQLGVDSDVGFASGDQGQLQNIVRCRYEDVAEVDLGARHE